MAIRITNPNDKKLLEKLGFSPENTNIVFLNDERIVIVDEGINISKDGNVSRQLHSENAMTMLAYRVKSKGFLVKHPVHQKIGELSYKFKKEHGLNFVEIGRIFASDKNLRNTMIKMTENIAFNLPMTAVTFTCYADYVKDYEPMGYYTFPNVRTYASEFVPIVKTKLKRHKFDDNVAALHDQVFGTHYSESEGCR